MRGLVPLRMMLGNIGVIVTPAQICIPFADKAFNKDGQFVDDKQKSNLKNIVKQFVDVASVLGA